MFWKKTPREDPPRHPFEDVDTTTVRRAENGSEMLYGLAQQLEHAGKAPGYVRSVRNAAHAIIEVLEHHPAHNAGPEKYREEHLGAEEHASEIQRWFFDPSPTGSDSEEGR